MLRSVVIALAALLSLTSVLLVLTGYGGEGANTFALREELNGSSSETSDVVPGIKMMKSVSGISQFNQEYNMARRYIISNGTSLFVCYNWLNGSSATLSMIHSPDKGITWTAPIDIWSAPSLIYVGIRASLHIWKSDLYVFLNTFSQNDHFRNLFYTKAPIENWSNIGSSTLHEIPIPFAIDFSIASDDSNLYLGVVRTSLLEGYFLKYNGDSWTTPNRIVIGGHCTRISIQIYNSGDTTKLLCFYNRFYESGAYTTGHTYLISSTDYGSSWSSTSTVMNDYTDYLDLHSYNINGTILLFSNRMYHDDIVVTISRDGGITWSDDMDIVTSRGSSTLGYRGNTMSVGVGSSGHIMVVYENSDDDVKMVYSKDWGSNWMGEDYALRISEMGSFNPIISNDGNYASINVMNKSTYNLELYNLNNVLYGDIKPNDQIEGDNDNKLFTRDAVILAGVAGFFIGIFTSALFIVLIYSLKKRTRDGSQKEGGESEEYNRYTIGPNMKNSNLSYVNRSNPSMKSTSVPSEMGYQRDWSRMDSIQYQQNGYVSVATPPPYHPDRKNSGGDSCV